MHFTTVTIIAIMSVMGSMASPVDNVERDTNKALNVGWKERSRRNHRQSRPQRLRRQIWLLEL